MGSVTEAEIKTIFRYQYDNVMVCQYLVFVGKLHETRNI